MNLNIDKKLYEEIANEINSDASVVGIDAKKTHILIIEKLIQIEKRLEQLEAKLDAQGS